MHLPRKFGQYELVKKVASGGMAEIFLARVAGIGGFEKLLVLKMIHPKWSRDEEFVSMLVEEAKLAVHLNHANIAQVFDLGKTDDTYYIAMEYVDGKDLFQLLVRTSELDSYLPFDVTAYIIEQVASALHYAHSRLDKTGGSLNLIHRDISPQNIIVSFNGEVKLIDFGIAKANVRESQTQVGVIKGKFFYMSPEQAWGRKLDHRTDIFSLGVCLHEMLTGQMLYAEENQLKLIDQIREARNPRPSQLRPGVPKELEALAMKALSPNANKRFQTAYEFQRSLTEYLHRQHAGFTPQRVARLMWDLFQDEGEATGSPRPPNTALNKGEYIERPSMDSMIYTALDRPAASTGEVARPVSPSLERPRQVVGGAHPPPPVAAPYSDELLFHEPTHVVDWDGFAQRHPEQLEGPFESSRVSDLDTSAPPLEQAVTHGEPPLTDFDQEGPTSLYDPLFVRAARTESATSQPVSGPPLAPQRRQLQPPARGPKTLQPALGHVARDRAVDNNEGEVPPRVVRVPRGLRVPEDPDDEGAATLTPGTMKRADDSFLPPTVVGEIPAEILAMGGHDEEQSLFRGIITNRAVVAVALICLGIVVLGCLGFGTVFVTNTP